MQCIGLGEAQRQQIEQRDFIKDWEAEESLLSKISGVILSLIGDLIYSPHFHEWLSPIHWLWDSHFPLSLRAFADPNGQFYDCIILWCGDFADDIGKLIGLELRQ